MGGEEVVTPNLDRLARQGTAFANAYVMGSMIGPVCVSARSMTLTGRGLFDLEREGRVIPPEHTTLPEAFRSAGYETFVSGKWHNDRESLLRIFDKGGTITGNARPSHWRFRAFDFAERKDHERIGVHSSEMIADEVIDFLNRRDRERPFFAYVPFLAPHWPWEAPWSSMSRYDRDEVSLPPNFLPRHPFDNGELGWGGATTETQKGLWLPRDPNQIREVLAAYYSMITHMDAQIGRILEAVEAAGEAGNTIVVFASDNGLALGQHGLLSKQSVYEHSAGVPLVFYGPGIPRRKTSDAFAYLHDIFPTLCGLTGQPVPPTVTGKDLAPVLRGERAQVRDSVVLAYKNFQRAVRVGDWKLHRYSVRGEETTLLFHLSEDPWERFDLSAEPLLADKVAELTRVMQEALREAGDDVDLSKAGWGVPEIPSHPGPETPKDGYPGYWGRGIEHEPGRDIPMGRH